MTQPPTIGELVAALRHDRDAFDRIHKHSTDAAVAMLGAVSVSILDRLLARVDAPVDAKRGGLA